MFCVGMLPIVWAIYLVFLLFYSLSGFLHKIVIIVWRNSPKTNSWSDIFTHWLFGNHSSSTFPPQILLCTVAVVEKNTHTHNRERVRLFCIPCVKIFPVNFVCIHWEPTLILLLKGHGNNFVCLFSFQHATVAEHPTPNPAHYRTAPVCACSIAIAKSALPCHRLHSFCRSLNVSTYWSYRVL